MTASGGKLRLIAPDEPPRLTPSAARTLLRILLKAATQRTSTAKTTKGGTT